MHLSKSFLNKKIINISIEFNIFFFLLILNFLSYSIYGALSKNLNLIFEFTINLNFIIFFYLYKKNLNDNLQFKLNLDLLETFLFLSLFILLFILLKNELTMPIMDDEVAYSSRSTRTSMYLAIYLANIFNSETINELPLKYFIHFLNFLQLLFVIFIILIIKKSKSLRVLILVLLINFIFRYVVKDESSHPPLNVLFSSIFTSIFGLHHIIFRLSYFIPFIIFLIFIYQLLKKSLGKTCSIFFILSLGTFPFLSLASVNPDHILWGSLILIYSLLYVIIEKKINYKIIFLIICTGILFRISLFSLFALIVACFLVDKFINKKNIFYEIKLFLFNNRGVYIILLCLPILVNSIFLGNPAFQGVLDANLIERLIYGFNSKAYIFSYINNIPSWYYFFIFLCVFTKRKFEILFFFIINLFIFISTNSDLLFLSKYSLEYALPFIILGQFILSKYFISRKKLSIIITITIFIIILNIYEIYNHPKQNISYEKIEKNGLEINKKIENKKKYITKFPYRYNEAYEYLEKINEKKNTIMFGNYYYSFLPQIIERYNLNELKNVILARSKFDLNIGIKDSIANRISIKLLNQDSLLKKKVIINNQNIVEQLNLAKDIKFLIITNYKRTNKSELIELLKLNKWSLEKEFYENEYKTKLLLFKKDTN